jgi:hypothetical protein
MRYEADPHVDAYIDERPIWQRNVCHAVRHLVHSVDPDVTETINGLATYPGVRPAPMPPGDVAKQAQGR